LCAHDMDNCTQTCKWCTKVQRWFKYHESHCQPKKCPYYLICNNTKVSYNILLLYGPYTQLLIKTPTLLIKSHTVT
jgi:hypothetical protein